MNPPDPSTENEHTVLVCILFITLILFSFSLCAGLHVLTMIGDRENKMRYLLNYIGLKPSAYVLGNILFDVATYFIAANVFLALLYLMGLEFMHSGWLEMLAVLTCHGYASITLTYLISLNFKTAVFAFNKIGYWYVIFGLLLPLVVSTILGLSIAFQHTSAFFQKFQYVLALDPFYGLVSGL